MTIAPPAPGIAALLADAAGQSISDPSGEPFDAALEAGSRANTTLSELSKLVSGLTGGLSGAQKANQQLVQELTALRSMLGSANEQQLALQERVALLERELTLSHNASERDRQFLTDQHDEFLAGILEEHEEALSSRVSQEDTLRMSGDVAHLAQQLVRAESARIAIEGECARVREVSGKAQAQRDEAQGRVAKLERERDELRAEASQLRARLGTHRSASTKPPPSSVTNRPASVRPAALHLDAEELDSSLHSRRSPRLGSLRPRLTSAPAELSRAVYSGPASVTPGPSKPEKTSTSSAPTAQPFPRESTRPGVGGPKPPPPPPPPSFGPPPSGWTTPSPAIEPAQPSVSQEPRQAPRPAVVSAASLPPGVPSQTPLLKQKPHPTTRPLFDYSLGEDGVLSETLEGARLSSKPPKK